MISVLLFCLQVHCTDGGGLSVGANVQFKLQDAILSQSAVQDLNHSLRMLAQVTLSRALEGKTAIIIQMDRKIINMHLQVTQFKFILFALSLLKVQYIILFVARHKKKGISLAFTILLVEVNHSSQRSKSF